MTLRPSRGRRKFSAVTLFICRYQIYEDSAETNYEFALCYLDIGDKENAMYFYDKVKILDEDSAKRLKEKIDNSKVSLQVDPMDN